MNGLIEDWRRFERWLVSLPDAVFIPGMIFTGAYIVISFMQFLVGLGDAPKRRPMCRLEVVFPAYQIGLWAGSRVGGEDLR